MKKTQRRMKIVWSRGGNEEETGESKGIREEEANSNERKI